MYPHLVYLSKPNERYKMYPVWVRDYPQGISSDAFNRRILKAGYKLSKKFGYDVYSCLPNHRHNFQMKEDLEMEERFTARMKRLGSESTRLYQVQEKEYELLDFYAEIGYDKSTGKINGRTLAQHIKFYMEKQP